MNRVTGILAVVVVLVAAVSCSRQSKQEPPRGIRLDLGQQRASNQSISCSFVAEVLSIVPMGPEVKIKGYVIDKDPNWTVELKVFPHERKIPFSPGIRRCSIADVEKVFGSPRKDVSGTYQFTYIYNVDVPGKPPFENFKARRIDAQDDVTVGEVK